MIDAIGNVGINDNYGNSTSDQSKAVVKNPGESTVKGSGRRSSPAECETCDTRKYQDKSDELVSFKSAAHISPANSLSKVSAHESEHVANAYKDAEEHNGKVLSASVTLKSAVCPECGRSYISGGETRTQIEYYNKTNPYQQNLKTADSLKYLGMNVDNAY